MSVSLNRLPLVPPFQDVEVGGDVVGDPVVVVVAGHGHRCLHLSRSARILSHKAPGKFYLISFNILLVYRLL